MIEIVSKSKKESVFCVGSCLEEPLVLAAVISKLVVATIKHTREGFVMSGVVAETKKGV